MSTSDDLTVAPTESASAGVSSGARYLLHDEIARGGMGAIYRATDTVLKREVAVKVLQENHAPDSGMARRFLDEARITAQLQHPAIPPIYDLGTLPDGRAFLAMKLIKGETLDAMLKDRANPSQRGPFLAIFEQICQAVAYAHAHDVIHRDLKPANVMVGAFGEVQVMDWGLAKVLTARPNDPDYDPEATTGTAIHSQRDSDDSQTQVGTILGTLAYMPPEQALGAITRINQRSDVFGLGAILAVILTGHPPFSAGSRESMRVQAAQGKLDDCFARLDVCGAEPDLIALCKRCLSPDPASRPKDADEVAKAVAGLRQAAYERARLAELDRVRAQEQRKRRRVQVTLGAVVLAAVLIGAWVWQAQSQKRTAARGELSAALEQSQTFLGRSDRSAALAAARQAEGLLGAAGDDADLKDAVAERLREIAFVATLEKVRTPETSSAERSFSRARADGRYVQAFRELGIDVDALTPEEAARQIEARPALKPYLIAALDDWVGPRRQARADPTAIRHLLQVSSLLDPEPWRDRLREALGQDDLAALLKLADEADVAKQTTSSLLTLAGLLNERGHRSEAIRLLRRAEWEHPDDFWLLCYQGAWNTFDVSTEALEEGVRCFSAAVALRPHFVEAWTGYSTLLGKQGKTEEALRASRRAVALAPNAYGGHLSLEKSLATTGQRAEADVSRRRCLEFLREHLRYDPEDDEAWVTLGLVLEREGDFAAALDAVRTAARISQRNHWARHNAGTLLRQQGKPKEALPWLEEAARLAPDTAHLLISLGMVRTECGDPIGAEKALRQAIAVQPLSLAAYGHLAESQRRRNDMGGSRATLELGARRCSEVLQKYPRAYHALWQLGLYRWKLGQATEAVEHLRRAVAVNPSGADAYIMLSLIFNEQGLLDEALAASREGVHHAPISVVILNNLAFDLMEKGESLDEAIRVIDRALALNPQSDVATLTKAELLRAQGQFAESLAAYRRGHELHQARGGGKWPTAAWVQDAERRVRLDADLPSVLAGERKLSTVQEYQEYAELCANRHQHLAAVRFYEAAFAGRSPSRVAGGVGLATPGDSLTQRLCGIALTLTKDEPAPELSTLAAKSAVLAGAGHGHDAPSAEADRAACRTLALHWLSEGLSDLQQRATGSVEQQSAVRVQLNRWRTHDAFDGVREPVALSELSEAEQAGWQKFWADVEALWNIGG